MSANAAPAQNVITVVPLLIVTNMIVTNMKRPL